MPKFNWVFFTLISLISTGNLFAQTLTNIIPKDNSPYSRFGLGDFVNQSFASGSGFANLSAAYQDPLHLNILNPASYASLKATAFEVGFYGEYARLDSKGEDSSTDFWNGNLNYLAVGFPLKNPINEVLDRQQAPVHWGMTVALLPFTNVGYNIEAEQSLPETGTITNSFKGAGGSYRFLWGTAVKYKNFSAGLNLGYLFGKETNLRRILFDELTNVYQDEFVDEISIRGFNYTLGFQYEHTFKKADRKGVLQPTDKKLVLGLYGNSATSFNTRSSQFYQRVNLSRSIAGLGFPSDTIRNVNNQELGGRLPAEFSFGLMYEKRNKLRLGANIIFSNWNKYENEAKPDVLENSFRLAFGGEHIPNATSYNRYLKRVRYRFGAFYGTDPRLSNGEQLKEYGITLGMGLPIIMPRQQTSFVNVALEVGQFGLSESLQETYARITLGFTLNDNTWFFKRKFN